MTHMLLGLPPVLCGLALVLLFVAFEPFVRNR